MADADTNVAQLAVQRPLTPAQIALVDGVREPLRKLAHKIVRWQRAGDVDDLTQIGVEIACRKVHTFVPGEASFLTAIYVRAQNAMLESLQSERREHLQAIAAL